MLLPLVVIPRLAVRLEFLPHVFLSEYAKLLGSTAVSVLVAWGWKHYDYRRHRKHATREWRLAAKRLQGVDGGLRALESSGTPEDNVSARAAFQENIIREIKSVLVVLDEVHVGLRGLSPDIREHLEEHCHATNELIDDLRQILNDGASVVAPLNAVKLSAGCVLKLIHREITA